MNKSKKIIIITLCILAIAAILVFAKADINHGHGLSDHAVTETEH